MGVGVDVGVGVWGARGVLILCGITISVVHLTLDGVNGK